MDTAPIALQVTKGGRNWFEYELRRCRGSIGLALYAKVVPEVEDFFKGLANEETTTALALYDRQWFPIDKNVEYHVYDMHTALKSTNVYSVDRIGGPLKGYPIMDPNSGRSRMSEGINLSFLRIKGISEPNGIRLGIRMPISRSEAISIGNDIINASRQLAAEYITPFKLNLSVFQSDATYS